jgi:7-cyano-7-deazaguanine synthase
MTVSFDLTEIGGSALTSLIEVPKSQDKEPSSSIPVTYVPARNTIFLSFALAWAEVLGTDNIFIGANAVDYSGYPDCRPEYLKAFETLANLATKVSVDGNMKFKIRAPLISMKKSEIIKKGMELGLDYSLTWSCYDPQPKKAREFNNISGLPDFRSDFVPCGSCDSCLLREKGFREAGIADPLIYH